MGLNELLKQLPLNRKERFYTGTVFPAVVGAHGFEHLHLLLQLIGAPAIEVSDDPATTRLLFFTEYGFKESLKGPIADQFTDPDGRDTPDVVVYIAPEGNHPGLLVGIEAKMFHRPSKAELEGQLAVQRKLLEAMAIDLGVPDPILVALLPQPLATGLGPLADPTVVITWEQVADRYRTVAPRYWIAMLDQARDRYGDLVSDHKDFSAYAHHHLSGMDIRAAMNHEGFEYNWVGRRGGIDGLELGDDFGPDGAWRGRRYQLRTTPPPGSGANWFSIDRFVDKTKAWTAAHAS